MELSTQTINKKITLLVGVVCTIFFIIIIRLLYLQIVHTDHFFQRSKQNFTRYEIINSPRGNICDCNNILLATNRPVTTIHWRGTGKNKLSLDQINLLHEIEKIVNQQLTTGNFYSRIAQGERRHQKILLASDISFEMLSKLAELYPNHPNISIDTHFKRHYPFQKYASHLIGYLGNISTEPSGVMGLEMMYDTVLRGKQGTKKNIVNSIGKRIVETEVEKGTIGNDVLTTVNIDIQTICENVFPDHYTGCLVLLNPHDGAIMSLVSRPNFDPNIFLNPISQDSWKNLQEKKPFLNRVFYATYPPGSIFKLVTLTAALEENIISKDDMWTCKGYSMLGKRRYWCNQRWGHGVLTTTQALAQSCNILFYEIGKTIDIDLLTHYAFKLGLGQKTSTVLSDNTGLIPSKKWKFENKGERWWQGETTSVAIGQSFLLTTPIQIARMIASIFTGYLVSPRLLVNEPVFKYPLDINSSTRDFLKESMKSVITKGTGRRLSTVKDIEIYAKTSTAQTSSLKKRSLDTSYLEHGWFVAYFKYKEFDPLVMVILVENVGTAQASATIAKNFLIQYKTYMDNHVM